jgi:hypothetical protein
MPLLCALCAILLSSSLCSTFHVCPHSFLVLLSFLIVGFFFCASMLRFSSSSFGVLFFFCVCMCVCVCVSRFRLISQLSCPLVRVSCVSVYVCLCVSLCVCICLCVCRMDDSDDPHRSITIPCLHVVSYTPINMRYPLTPRTELLSRQGIPPVSE